MTAKPVLNFFDLFENVADQQAESVREFASAMVKSGMAPNSMLASAKLERSLNTYVSTTHSVLESAKLFF